MARNGIARVSFGWSLNRFGPASGRRRRQAGLGLESLDCRLSLSSVASGGLVQADLVSMRKHDPAEVIVTPAAVGDHPGMS